MPSSAEIKARELLADNGRNRANHSAGIRVGSPLHLCEMLLAELDETRKTLKLARPYVESCAEPNGKDNASAVLRDIDVLLQ